MINKQSYKKINKHILVLLKKKQEKLTLEEIKKILIEDFNYSEDIENKNDAKYDIFSSKIHYALDVLKTDGYIIEGARGGSSIPRPTFGISSRGLNQLIWYKKFWRFFTEDMAKILSIIAMVISIISFWYSIGE